LALGWGRAFLRRKLRRASSLDVPRCPNDIVVTEPIEFLVGFPPGGCSERSLERGLWPHRQFLLERLVIDRLIIDRQSFPSHSPPENNETCDEANHWESAS
jgi:hypothetical protein